MNSQELKNIAVLRDVDNEALVRLATVLQEKEYADGHVVFSEGDPGDSMYFIVEGHVRIEKLAQAAGALPKTLTVLEAGDYFGEMALMDQKSRSASAVAAGGARLLRFSKAAFDELQQQRGGVGINVLFAMIRTSSERIRRLTTQVVVYDEVGKAIGEAPDLQSLLDVILKQLLAATLADWGLLLLRSQFSDRFDLRALANLTLTPGQRESVLNGDGFLGAVLRDPQARLIADFAETEAFKSCPHLGFETPSLLISPIMLEHEFLGLILLGGRERNLFNLDALNLARGVARQAAQAIVNARHREENQARLRHSRQYVKF